MINHHRHSESCSFVRRSVVYRGPRSFRNSLLVKQYVTRYLLQLISATDLPCIIMYNRKKNN